MKNIEPIMLEGNFVRLVPLAEAHIAGLTAAAHDPDTWLYIPSGYIDTVEKMAAHVQAQLTGQQKGTDLPFTVVHAPTSKIIGMTRYLDIQPQNRALEIGGTWYTTAYRRTAANTECKYLLLRHAFETLGCNRVQLKTDLRNLRSQRAMERIGAVREGVLRSHLLLPDGTFRSSVYYSILASEWPAVKEGLEKMLTP